MRGKRRDTLCGGLDAGMRKKLGQTGILGKTFGSSFTDKLPARNTADRVRFLFWCEHREMSLRHMCLQSGQLHFQTAQNRDSLKHAHTTLTKPPGPGLGQRISFSYQTEKLQKRYSFKTQSNSMPCVSNLRPSGRTTHGAARIAGPRVILEAIGPRVAVL